MTKRAALLASLALLLSTAARPCMPQPTIYHSMNGAFCVWLMMGKLACYQHNRLLWSVPEQNGAQAVIADDGSCSVQWSSDSWIARDRGGRVLSRFTVQPQLGVYPPLRFLTDQARTCWRSGDSAYLQFSQVTCFVCADRNACKSAAKTRRPTHHRGRVIRSS